MNPDPPNTEALLGEDDVDYNLEWKRDTHMYVGRREKRVKMGGTALKHLCQWPRFHDYGDPTPQTQGLHPDSWPRLRIGTWQFANGTSSTITHHPPMICLPVSTSCLIARPARWPILARRLDDPPLSSTAQRPFSNSVSFSATAYLS